jgi:ribonuclease E
MDNKHKMLIDATHPEETRVVVLRNGRVEEFDYESAARKLLRGNIYLAKVTRVEPSLQAAFVDYGGNRHGFLAFSEIHPDYYQIPIADRQALLQEEAEAEAEADAEADARAEQSLASQGAGGDGEQSAPQVEALPTSDDQPVPDVPEADVLEPQQAGTPSSAEAQFSPDPISTAEADFNRDPIAEAETASASDVPASGTVEEIGSGDLQEVPEMVGGDDVDEVGSEDALEEVPVRPRRHRRSYKIQEVIKRRQIILVQVVKEERGNKGAALTTYLSLAGRYTVLMPNTGRGGGISRKITNAQDRKRLKAIASELEVPEGMGLIIRTAGAARTKQEIRRDFEYLLRLWESVREMTLQSTAPSLVYEEGNLIKRSIRDLYSKDIEEIVVAGEPAHSEAHEFMRMLMPSHAQNVIRYESPEPIFTRYQIERQLNAMFSPYVTLRSGGYLVINQTEALVSIDVNSGKSTREYSIEETALNTNVEAAEEIARQLKLRDLAGLIVIDFIDMEEKRNNRAVERRLKDALRHDRARIQVGRISHFGLLEMSRQRLRTGVLEGSTSQCPHCQGTGIIRSTESVALAVLRGLEDHLMRNDRSSLTALTTANVALYILNNKRAFIQEMEARHGISIAVQASERMQGANFAIERSSAPVLPQKGIERAAVNMEWGFEGDDSPLEPERGGQGEGEFSGNGEEENGGRQGRRRRRRRGRRDDRNGYASRRHDEQEGDTPGDGLERQDADSDSNREAAEFSPAGEVEDVAGDIKDIGAEGESREEQLERRGRRGRRRGRRGGRRGRDGFKDRGEQPRADFADAGDAGHDRAPGLEDQPTLPATEIDPAEIPASDADPTIERGDYRRQSQDEHVRRAPQPDQSEVLEHREGRALNATALPSATDPRLEPEPSPGLETVRLTGEGPATAPGAEDAARPVKKGWWLRRFGAE